VSTAQLEVPAPPAVDDRGVPAGAWVVDCVLDRPAALSQRGAMPASIRVADGIEVLFDGELFDLDQLAAKWHVSQAVASDPASIALEAYRRLGRDCVDVLNGRFAMLVADHRSRQVLAIRDRIGFHPLFYASTPTGFLFSPSIPGLLAQPHVSQEVDRVVLAEHLLHRFVDPQETYFSAVRRVPPGHVLTVGDGTISTRRYWNPAKGGWLPADATEGFEAAFDRAVDRCTNQGRVGLWLSGGFDSVSVAAMAVDLARKNGRPAPHALSLGFPEPSNEEVVQRGVAQSLGISQDFVPYQEAVAAGGGAVRAAMTLAADWPQPLTNFWYPAYGHLARIGVSRGCRSILTGTGGDEWLNVSPFLGADLVRQGKLMALARLAAMNRRSFRLSIWKAWKGVFWRFGARPLLGRALESATPHWSANRRRAALRAMPSWVAPDPQIRKRMDERVSSMVWETRPPQDMAFYEWQMHIALEHTLVTMEYEEHYEFGRRFGVRLLHPYLDPDLVELLFRLPPEALIKGGRSKALVRQTLARRFPDLGFDRQRKLDASTFFRRTLVGEGSAGWQSIGGAKALQALGVLSAPEWETEFQNLRSNEQSLYMYRIWLVLNLETWARTRV